MVSRPRLCTWVWKTCFAGGTQIYAFTIPTCTSGSRRPLPLVAWACAFATNECGSRNRAPSCSPCVPVALSGRRPRRCHLVSLAKNECWRSCGLVSPRRPTRPASSTSWCPGCSTCVWVVCVRNMHAVVGLFTVMRQMPMPKCHRASKEVHQHFPFAVPCRCPFEAARTNAIAPPMRLSNLGRCCLVSAY